MTSIICPISNKSANKPVVRMTGLLIATTVFAYALTGQFAFLIVLFVDFIIRGFTELRYSPLSWLASKMVESLNLTPSSIDKAPKIFAARVGLLFSVAASIMYFISLPISITITLILMSFALLESLFDFCVGCVVYTYIVLPLNKRP